MSREEYSGLELDSKVEMIRALIPLGLMHVEELLDEEVKALAGERYARKEATLRGRRHGSNPGLGGHFKTGQWWSPQKRPMGMARDSVVLPL